MPHDLTIHKRVRDGQLVPFPSRSINSLPEYFDQDSNAVCGWKSTEQASRDEFLNHILPLD